MARPGAIVIVSVLVHGPAAWGQCSNDVGTGDIAESEICAGDLYDDTTNSGCNTTPAAFTELSAADFAVAGFPYEVLVCGSGSTYRTDTDGDGTPDTNNRDTDWYRIDQATLASFDADGNGIARELLSKVLDWQQVFAPDNSVFRTILGEGSIEFDDNGDGVSDRFESAFNLTSAGQLDLTFQLTQQLESVPGVAAVLTQTLVITNNRPDPVDFTLVRSMDGLLVWDAAGNTVGTGANGSGCRYVFQGEVGLPSTYITISSNEADLYFGAKAGIDPDGAGPCPPMGSGSDVPLWNAYGVPCAWENYIAGADVNGESGPAPPGCTAPCDASIGLEIPVTGLGPGASTTVIVQTTYGAASPLGMICDPCPWDCGDFNGDIGIVDFLALLGQWGRIGETCDLGIGAPGVGIEEFLVLLANWGPCP